MTDVAYAEDSRAHSEWEEIYRQPGASHKNRYPDGDVVRFVMRNLRPAERRETRVLDLGCGWGNHLRFLVDLGLGAAGIDGSVTAVRHCRTFAPLTVAGSLAALPWSDGCFDAAIDRNSIQCNTREAMARILRETHRVLKPGGLLYSSVLAQTNQPASFHAYYLTDPESRLTEDQVRDLFSSFGSLELDYSERTYDGGRLFVRQWHATARKVA